MFAEDANNTLWTERRRRQVVGWLNTKMFDETDDEVKSQGWTPLILDTNGNGKRDEYVEPDQPVDPDEGQAASTAASTPSRRRRTDRSGDRSSASRARSSAWCPARIRRETALAEVLRAAVEQSEGAGAGLLAARRATSIATAWSGRRWRAATWRASIAASARVR